MSTLPHIICILSDEHFGGAMSGAGDPNVRTPSMDRLAAEGVSFGRAYANCPVCTPSRGTIFSGRHAHAGPVQGFFDVYKPSSPSLATMLKSHGYRTAYFGKWHCGVIRDQIPPEVRQHRSDYPEHDWITRTPEWHRAGFEDWFAFEINNKPFDGFYYHQNEVNPRRFNGYQTDALTDLAIRYLEEYGRDQPLLLVLSVEPPHFPFEAPQRNCRFDPAALQTRPNFAGDSEVRRKLAIYYAMVENLDDNIGRLTESVDRLERFSGKTLLSYISDHGDLMGSHGAIGAKVQPYEESVRIPYLFRYPGQIPAQGTRDEFISLVDYVPTVLGLIGVEIPSHIQGCDMSRAVRGQPHVPQDALLLEMHGCPRWSLDFPDWRGFVSKQWKYAFFETGHEVLFDLIDDPFEMHDLAREQPQTCQRLRQQLLAMLRDSREPYFDVLIEHGAKIASPTSNIGPYRLIGHGLSPYWRDGSTRDVQGE